MKKLVSLLLYITEIVTNTIVIRKEFVISNDKTK